MQINDRIGNERSQLCAGNEIITIDLRVIDRLRANHLQDAVVFPDTSVELFGKKPGLHQIGNSQSGASRLIAIGGTDSALGGADPGAPFSQLPLFVECPMVWKNQMRAITDEQVLVDSDSDFSQPFYFI